MEGICFSQVFDDKLSTMNAKAMGQVVCHHSPGVLGMVGIHVRQGNIEVVSWFAVQPATSHTSLIGSHT